MKMMYCQSGFDGQIAHSIPDPFASVNSVQASHQFDKEWEGTLVMHQTVMFA